MRRIIRRSVLCCPGSLSQRAQGLPKLEPKASTILGAVELSKWDRPMRQEGGLGKRIRASMLVPQETEATDFKKLIVMEKHLLRERQFEAEKKKRRLNVEKQLQLKVCSTPR